MKRIAAFVLAALLDFSASAQVTTNPSVTGVPQPQSAVAITGGTISGVTLSASSITDTGLTATRVPFATTGGLLTDSAAFTFTTGTGSLGATTFVGALTGNASGSAATVTGAAQPAITSLGTLGALNVTGTTGLAGAVNQSAGLMTITKNNGTTLGSAYQLYIVSSSNGQRSEIAMSDGVTANAYLSFLPSATPANSIMTLQLNE